MDLNTVPTFFFFKLHLFDQIHDKYMKKATNCVTSFVLRKVEIVISQVTKTNHTWLTLFNPFSQFCGKLHVKRNGMLLFNSFHLINRYIIITISALAIQINPNILCALYYRQPERVDIERRQSEYKLTFMTLND